MDTLNTVKMTATEKDQRILRVLMGSTIDLIATLSNYSRTHITLLGQGYIKFDMPNHSISEVYSGHDTLHDNIARGLRAGIKNRKRELEWFMR